MFQLCIEFPPRSGIYVHATYESQAPMRGKKRGILNPNSGISVQAKAHWRKKK